MLNYCIQRKRERYEQSSKPVSTSSSSASLQARPASPSSINKLELPGSPKETKWVVDTMDSGSDDEFFEAVEEQERVLQSSANEEMDIALQKDSISESPSGSFMSLNRSATDIVLERTGVLKETEMLLLETNEPLCIPITQVFLYALIISKNINNFHSSTLHSLHFIGNLCNQCAFIPIIHCYLELSVKKLFHCIFKRFYNLMLKPTSSI